MKKSVNNKTFFPQILIKGTNRITRLRHRNWTVLLGPFLVKSGHLDKPSNVFLYRGYTDI